MSMWQFYLCMVHSQTTYWHYWQYLTSHMLFSLLQENMQNMPGINWT